MRVESRVHEHKVQLVPLVVVVGDLGRLDAELVAVLDLVRVPGDLRAAGLPVAVQVRRREDLDAVFGREARVAALLLLEEGLVAVVEEVRVAVFLF